ncbi:MAG: cellobiose phosphorylase [Candidatus Omnitrophota bacterium]
MKYYIGSNGEFVIENYNHASPFSNFLPGIAGLFGIPMWVFYVNRGQCICSFGVKSKDSPIMEFMPANRAYQLASSQGFRTFIKIRDKKKNVFYEPFRPHFENSAVPADQKMFVTSYGLKLVEKNPSLGIEITVEYFTIPNESFAALARIVTFKNISKKDISMDVLDGTPLIIPCGVSNFFLQKMRRTVEAWMTVENIEKGAPFYRLKVDPRDVSEVKFIDEGNFYLSTLARDGKTNGVLPILVDPELIFGQINDFSYPVNFINEKKFHVPQEQIRQNKLPCAMSLAALKLKKGASATLYSLMGHMSSKDKLNSMVEQLIGPQFFTNKREENKNIIKEIQESVFTVSGEKGYDFYCRQTFLDNVMRGGYPVNYGDKAPVFYAYSRKHGDLERDYNRFYIDPTYFSQGNGNFRDMNQNRRNDIFFDPDIKDSNILHFYNLIQTDGFNPLLLCGVRFKLKSISNLTDDLKGKVYNKDVGRLKELVSRAFTPGKLFMEMETLGIKMKTQWQGILESILKNCEIIYDAEHSEGFWIDHWTYNLDLIESYLAVYPERLKEILFYKKEFTFYDNVFCVKPRSEKCILNGGDRVRQYHALARDSKKEHIIKKREHDSHLVRTRKGEGGVYKTTLFVKLLCLTANKMASLGPFGTGIEMEADKPGWCDSMNGLPGLFGTSTPEVFELKRQIVFILTAFKNLKLEDSCKLKLPEELYDFLKSVESIIKKQSRFSAKKRDFNYWDSANYVKEKYRERVKFGFTGNEKSLTVSQSVEMLRTFLLKIEGAVKKVYLPSQKIYPTYFINEVTSFERTGKTDVITDMPLVKPTGFKSIRIPLFLEGIVRAMKSEKDTKKAKILYRAVKKTGLYDKKLRMYKINESLEGVSKEVGRSSIFTPGWLENESIWLHMEYKYLLEILRAGLYEEFFDEFKNCLVPFMKPEVYGRSIFENSSFIVSSAFPDERLHGKGFVARLSGSTAEMLSMWVMMNIGQKPFFLNDKGDLTLQFKPALPAWLFTKNRKNGFPKNSYAFKFLNKTIVVYHNPRMKNTAGRNSVRTRLIILKYDNGKKIEIKRDLIELPYSQEVRDRKIERIDIYLG